MAFRDKSRDHRSILVLEGGPMVLPETRSQNLPVLGLGVADATSIRI